MIALDGAGKVSETSRIPTTQRSLRRWFGGREATHICIEASGISPWVARLIMGLGHDVIVATGAKGRG